MKELKIVRCKYDAELPDQFDYVEDQQRTEAEIVINTFMTKGWEIQNTHVTKSRILFFLVRDIKLRLLENESNY